jgi:hypothetical protein
VVGIFSIYSGAYFFFAIFQCGMPNGTTFWLKKLANQCIRDDIMLGMGYTHAILSALTDLFFLGLIYPVVSKTHLKSREKKNVALLLALSTVGFVASVVRIKWISILVTHNLDFFYKALWLGIWSAIEPGIGIIASSLATLRPLVRQIDYSSGSWGRWTWSKTKSTQVSSGTKFASGDTKQPITGDEDIEKQTFTEPETVHKPKKTFLNSMTKDNNMTFFRTATSNLSPMVSKDLSASSEYSQEDVANDWFPTVARETITSPQPPGPQLSVSSLTSTSSPSPWASYAIINPNGAPPIPPSALLRTNSARPRTGPSTFRMPSSQTTMTRSRHPIRPFEWAGTADGLVPMSEQVHTVEPVTEPTGVKRGISKRTQESRGREGLSLGIFGNDENGRRQRKRLSGSSIANSIADRLNKLRGRR